MKEILQDTYGYVGVLLRSFDEVISVFYAGNEVKVGQTLVEIKEKIQRVFLVLEKNKLVDLSKELVEFTQLLSLAETLKNEKKYCRLGDLFQGEIYFFLLCVHEKIEKGLIDKEL